MRFREVALAWIGGVIVACSPSPEPDATGSDSASLPAAEPGGSVECPEDPSYAGPVDFEIPGGWFFTQRGCGPGVGYAVTDDGHPARGGAPARFFTFFSLMGGPDGIGYPRSTRFVGPDERVRQLFDGGLAVADPATGWVSFDDVLARAEPPERDSLIAQGVPAPAPSDGFGSLELEAAWRAGPRHPAWCPFGDLDAASLFGTTVGPLDPETGAQPFERAVLRADGTLWPLGEALEAVAVDGRRGDAAFVPGHALVGEPAPQVPDSLAPLQAMLEEAVSEHAGEVAIAITDLRTGETVAVNGERKQFAASSIKLWMITTALSRLDDGSAPYELADLDRPVREVLSWSSNDAARALTDMAGIDSVNRHMLQHGMTRSLLVWWGPEQVNRCFEAGLEEAWFGGNSHLTASDVNRYLADLHGGHVLELLTDTWFVETATEETPVEFFTTWFPVDERDIASFNVRGFNPPDAPGPEALNDIGIVEVRDAGYAFAFAVLTQYNADHAAARAFVAAVGSTTLDFFDGRVYADGR